MKRIVFRIFGCLFLMFGCLPEAAADIQPLSPVLSAEIPNDYTLKNLERNKMVYYSPDRKTMIYITKYVFSNLPSGWSDVKKYDKNLLHYDSLECISDKHSYFWQLNKDFCTRTYAVPAGTLVSDTRCIYPNLLINTVFVDYTGHRNEVLDTYLASLTSSEKLSEQFERVVTGAKWFWIILAILISVIGALAHDDSNPFGRYLNLSGVVALAVGGLLAVLLYGEWALVGIFMGLAFLLAFVCAWLGITLKVE